MTDDSEQTKTAIRAEMIVWFRVYCAVFALIAFVGALAMLRSLLKTAPSPDAGMAMAFAMQGGLLLICLGLTTLYTASFLLPRKPWVWTYDLVLIGLGMWHPCFWIVCIPLFIAWLKPEMRLHFGR
jgi:hypothetical protein